MTRDEELKNELLNVVSKTLNKVPKGHKALLEILFNAWDIKSIHQSEIIGNIEWIEATRTHGKAETRMRRLRSQIRDLRIKYGILIVVDSKGTRLVTSYKDAIKFIRDTKLNIESRLDTYKAMKNILGIDDKTLDAVIALLNLNKKKIKV